jgi:hypothetical protein
MGHGPHSQAGTSQRLRGQPKGAGDSRVRQLSGGMQCVDLRHQSIADINRAPTTTRAGQQGTTRSSPVFRSSGRSRTGAVTLIGGRARTRWRPHGFPWVVLLRAPISAPFSSSRPSTEVGRRRGARGSGPFPSASSRWDVRLSTLTALHWSLPGGDCCPSGVNVLMASFAGHQGLAPAHRNQMHPRWRNWPTRLDEIGKFTDVVDLQPARAPAQFTPPATSR